MPVEKVSVFMVSCDECKRPLLNTAAISYTLEFATAAAALYQACMKKWLVTPQDVLCPGCRAESAQVAS